MARSQGCLILSMCRVDWKVALTDQAILGSVRLLVPYYDVGVVFPFA